jgi:hypothetical protein
MALQPFVRFAPNHRIAETEPYQIGFGRISNERNGSVLGGVLLGFSASYLPTIFGTFGLVTVPMKPQKAGRYMGILFTNSVAFASSVQVQTFREVSGHSYNLTFTTGNLRRLSEAAFMWLFEGQARHLA